MQRRFGENVPVRMLSPARVLQRRVLPFGCQTFRRVNEQQGAQGRRHEGGGQQEY